MILEERDYHIRPGRLNDFITAYRKLGFEIQNEALEGFVGQFVSDIGELNHVVALWCFESISTVKSDAHV